MRRLLLSLLLLATATTVFAQSPVKQRDIKGTWKLVFDIDRSEGESSLERIALSAVDGFLDELDIRMTFKSDGELIVHAEAFGDSDTEYSDWTIDDDGRLHIGDSESLNIDEDNVWLREGKRLVPYEMKSNGELERSDNVYLVRLRR